MAIKVAINGFGRIGKCILRAYAEGHYPEIEIVGINIGFGDFESELHFLKYDSTHGIFQNLKGSNNCFDFGKGLIPIMAEPDAKKLPWGKMGVDIVLECTGAFTKKSQAIQHIEAGAKKVIVSAPCEEADATIVYGVNENKLTAEHKVISIGSCTTNCLAPMAKIFNDAVGIESGFMTTIHAYTNDQKLLDSNHKDKRRARAAGLSMIPSSTGAAKALGLVLPELAGKLDGVSIRVPTPNVSFVDLKFNAKRDTSVSELNKIFKDSLKGNLAKIAAYVDEELVSIDFNHNPASCSFDSTQTKVISNRMCRVAAWYDNEWGFSNRMLDITKIFGKL